ncbi:MAG: hypothetical protein NT045_02225 [Candidatus Aureabacteria bacterium]|nr:hypothetical protein [Candidatus Auribacterota bacterium]
MEEKGYTGRVGGRCDYKGYEGRATVTRVEQTAASRAQSKARVTPMNRMMRV